MKSLRQRLERFPYKEDVIGSSPVGPTTNCVFAQTLAAPSIPSAPSLGDLRLFHQEGDLLRVQVNSRVCSHLL